MAALTMRRLGRATLARQLLLERADLPAVEAVRRVVALQAQEPASPYLALWTRLERFDATELHEAFAAHQVIKASLMRITLHAVHADDYPALRGAVLPILRAARLHDARFKATGLSIADADALVPRLQEHLAQPRLGADAEAFVEQHVGPTPKPGPWWALRTFGPYVHAATGGPWGFGLRPHYLAAPTPETTLSRAECVQHLVLRYLEGFGPGTPHDVARFALIDMVSMRTAFAALSDRLERLEGPGGEVLYDVPGAPRPPERTPAPPRLLPMWDSTLLAHRDRTRLLPEPYRRLVIRSNGDVLPAVLVDGQVAGVWRPVEGAVEVTAFHELPAAAWRGLRQEATRLLAFLTEQQATPYGRYARWWARLPEAETRLLG